MPAQAQKRVTLFLTYAHEDRRLMEQFKHSLSSLEQEGKVASWNDRDIKAGDPWAKQIDAQLNRADIILLLVSPDFIASPYCFSVEMNRALERHEAGEARVIPIILRPTAWQNTPIGKLQALPTDGRPITLWPHHDEAFLDIVEHIRVVIEEISVPTKVEKSKQLWDALADYKQAILENPDDPLNYNGMGDVLMKLRQYSEALEAYKQANLHDPRLVYAYSGKAWAFNSLGRDNKDPEQHRKALQACEEALRLDLRNVYVYTNQAWALNSLGQYDDALQVCEEALKLDPPKAAKVDCYLNMAWAFNSLGRDNKDPEQHRKALQACEEALNLLPLEEAKVNAYNNMAWALNSLGRYRQALQVCEEALKLDPNNSDARGNKRWALTSL